MWTNFFKKYLLFLMMPLVANSQNSYLPPVFADKTRTAKIQALSHVMDEMYKRYAEEKQIPGYAFGIVVDGKLIFTGSGGYANIQKKTKVTAQTMFRIASMTKSFTAMAILQLRDQSKLKLDDPVFLYIPEMKHQKLTSDASEITIRDLLTHVAGLPKDDPWADRNLDWTEDELHAIIKKGLSFSNAPRTAYEYSNLGFAMLGLIIKKVSHLTYQQFVAENIWKPLGLKDVSWEFSAVHPNQLAHGYSLKEAVFEEEKLEHDGSFAAIGGMITSIESFSRYMALYQQAWPPRDEIDLGPLKRSSLREMQLPMSFNEIDSSVILNGQKCPMVSSYGYGLRWLKDCQSKIYVGHGGGLPGFGSSWFIMPDYGIGAVLFTNLTYAPAYEINLQVLNRIVQDAKLKPREIQVSPILQERQKALIGLLPDWNNAKSTDIFALNFFLDSSIDAIKKKSQEVFVNIGKIKRIGKMIAENQLRGYFIIEGEKGRAKVHFTLSPEPLALIQSYQIEEIPI